MATQFTSNRPIGISNARAISIAKMSRPSEIGAVYMFCIHASTPRTAVAAKLAAAARWLKIGLRAKVGRISEMTPNANSRITT